MYKAIISKVSVRPHPNADKLALGNCFGYQVIVGKDTPDGAIGIFFPPDGQLSEEYVEANKLHKKDGGYFDDRRRVRAQRFRGEKSEGLWMPLNSLLYAADGRADYVDIKQGTTLTEINGRPICNRYETKRTRSQRKSGANKQAIHNIYFKKHIETEQFRFYKDQIPTNSVITITEKLHGTSGRYGNVLTETKPKWWQRLLGIKPPMQYKYLLGTRNVILTDDVVNSGTSYYGNEQFRFNAVDGLELHQGEVIYFELVGGYCDQHGNEKFIMPPHIVKDTKAMKDVVDQYGGEMLYSYDTYSGQTKLYVYRITRTTPDGAVTELSWNQVKQRCNQLGLKYVPEFGMYVLTGSDYTLHDALAAEVDHFTEGPSTLDPTHIREGCVVRVDHENGTDWYKNKSFTFGVLEGYIKDDDNYEDMEEAS